MSIIFFRTVIIFVSLSLAMKAMGKRQLGELEVGELITTLLVSEVCSIPIDDPDIPLLNAIIPVIFIVSAELIISHLKNKSSKLKKIFDGTPIFIVRDGKLNQKALIENRISIEEFMCELRQNGVGSIEDVENCILEANGKISVLESGSSYQHILISDGEIMQNTLKRLGLNENWIKSKLKNLSPENVFIMTYNESGDVNIIRKEEKE